MPYDIRRTSGEVVTPPARLSSADRRDLAAYLLGGAKALDSNVGLANLAHRVGAQVRTLIAKHRQVRLGRSARRATEESSDLLEVLGRREFVTAMTSGVLLGVSGAERLVTLLPPRERRLLEWLVTVRRRGIVLPATRDLLPLRAWKGYAFDWIDADILEQLGKCLCEQPQLFLSNTLVQQVWSYALGEYDWMISGSDIAREVAARLEKLSWAGAPPLAITSLDIALAPVWPASAASNWIERASRRGGDEFFEGKLAEIFRHYELKGEKESQALGYVRIIVEDTRRAEMHYPTSQILQRARTVLWLSERFPAVAKLPESSEVIDRARARLGSFD